MRKLLSVILAITMVLSTVAFAIPSAVTVMEKAEETAGESDMADLAAVKTLARGVNMLTGTKDAFDGDNYTDLSWLTPNANYSDISATIVDDPTGVKDKVVSMNFPAGISAGYPNFKVDFGGDLDTNIGHTYLYLAFDYQKYVSDPSGYISNKSFWMLNTYTTSGDYAAVSFDIDANEGWIHFGKVLDYSVNQNGYEIDNAETNSYYSSGQDINKSMIIQFGVNTDNSSPIQMLFDNFMIVPAYKVTYYNAAGTEVVKEDFVVVDEEGNVLSSFAPKAVLDGRTVYNGWSATMGGAAVKEVALNESDIVLYATVEEDAFEGATISLDKKLTEIGKTATASVNLNGGAEYDISKATWKTEDTSIATVSYDKDKGIATVKALKAGTTNITFTYGDYSVTDTITVATSAAQGDFAGLDADTYEYVTVNVTNADAAAKDVVVSFETTEGEGTVTLTAPASVSGYDLYADLTNNENWGGEVLSVSAEGATINNTKLWAELDTENGVELVSDINLISQRGQEIVVTAVCTSDLEGVYGEEYEISVDADASVASCVINGNTVTITGVAGNGSVVITAASKDDASVSAAKEILVNVVEGKAIGYMWDFNDASNTGFDLTQRYTASAFNGSTANVVAAKAVLPGGTEAVPVEFSEGTVDGKSVTIVKQTTYGTMSSATTPDNLSIEEYPYLVIKARASSKHSHKLGIYMGYTNHPCDESKRKLTPDVTFTEDFELHVIDASESAALAAGDYFTKMMFSTNQDSTVSSEIKQSGSTYYIEGDVEFDPYYNIEIDEMYFANYDPTATLYGVDIKADKTSIDGDGIVTITSQVFASDVVENDDVNYTVSDTSLASLFKNSDGTATVTPLKDGTVTITATSVMDETAADSITLTFTNIPTRTVAYDLKLMLIGNSYLEHGYLATADKDKYNGYMSPTDIPRGMAATSPELDYYSRLCYYLQNGFNATFTSKKQGGAVIEQAWKQGLASGTPTNLAGWDRDKSEEAMKNAAASIVDYMQREQPNLITVQLAENAAHAYEESAEFFYDWVFKMIDDNRPENSVVVIISPMGTNASSKVQKIVGAKYGFHWADNTWIGDENGWTEDNPYLAFQHYPDYTNSAVVEFRSHPGNLGMDEIAKSAYALFEQYIPTTIPARLVTVPKEITIGGNDTITNAGGKVQLSVSLSPASSAPDVYWSVDNEYLASVDESGVVTALLNGEVTVKAVSAYDDRVVATKKITISGQTQHYALTYDAGANGEIENIPEAFAYAAGTYTFPTLTALPERCGYKFLGWSQEKGGEVIESIEMTSDKTVYAVWQFADSWGFDKDNDLEGISVGGFNTAVKDGVLTTISYDGIAVGVSDTTLLVPAGMYKTFKANVSMSTVNNGDYFTLTITNDKGVQTTYEANTLVGMNEYVFDISDVTGTITGFSLVTSNDADGVGMTVDSMEFVKSEITADTVLDSYEASASQTFEANGNKVTINNLAVASDATLTLGDGTYVIGEITGDGAIKASMNANVIVTGDKKPRGYLEIVIGEKAEGEVRYAEIDGKQFEIKEETGNDVYGMIVSKNTLVEIVTETAEGIFTKYYYVNATNVSFEEIALDDYMGNRDELNTMRAPDSKLTVPGLRFAANIKTANKNNSEKYEIVEYGYIIAVEDTLNANGEQLNLNASKYVRGKAYSVADGIDKVYNSTDELHVFTGILYGVPKVHYGTNLVAKTYTVVRINGGNFVIYGEEMVESFYSMAKKLEGEAGLTEETRNMIEEIITTKEELDKDLNLPGDDLYE